MRYTSERHTNAADRTAKDIRRKTRKRYSSEGKIRMMLAGRKRLAGDTAIKPHKIIKTMSQYFD